MTIDEIENFTRQAGGFDATPEFLERFAALVAASERVDRTIARYQIEDEQKWREEIETMPFIQFPADWHIQVIPPFGDAVVRFRVRRTDGEFRSIYLDSRCSLGYWEGPYWEVYPYRGDTGRCDKEDITELLRMIADTEEA